MWCRQFTTQAPAQMWKLWGFQLDCTAVVIKVICFPWAKVPLSSWGKTLHKAHLFLDNQGDKQMYEGNGQCVRARDDCSPREQHVRKQHGGQWVGPASKLCHVSSARQRPSRRSTTHTYSSFFCQLHYFYFLACLELRMYLWWSSCTLYLHACQVRITTGISGLWCCICVTYFEC